MASTNKTANLGLNQWVLSDPVLMEDFNADNLKIDAAVSANPYVKLLSITTTADAQQVDLDVSLVDFSRYSIIQVITDASVTPVNKASYIFARINNSGGIERQSLTTSTMVNQNYVSRSSANTLENYRCTIKMEISGIFSNTSNYFLRVRTSSATWSNGYNIEETFFCIPFIAGAKPMNINFLSSSSEAYIKAGSKFLVYGVKI
ncbi:MAG: hypothetical protein GX488_01105 [Clostridiales bacterium]|nr:hypothetical protein [Clostridiales bacterium]